MARTNRVYVRRTHCMKGHEYTPENTKFDARGVRQCKECNADRARARYAKDPEKFRSAHQAKRALKAEITPERRREVNLKYIGWTPEAFDAAFAEQEGKCEICKKILTLEKKISGSRACADHEHIKPPKRRGILCVNCNLGIGNLKDDPEIMLAAIAYVKKWKEG